LIEGSRGPPVRLLVSWIGEAILLIELAMEMVNKEDKERKEDEEDERKTAQYYREIRCLLYCWNPCAGSISLP
jgi:hypothetical protein